jgi:hypothetical protein
MAKQIWQRNEPDYRGEKNETRENREYEIIGKRRRHLQRVMPYQIPVRTGEGPLYAAEVHSPNVFFHLGWEHTRKTVYGPC